MYVTFETKGLHCEDETLLDLIQNNSMKIQIRLWRLKLEQFNWIHAYGYGHDFSTRYWML